MEVTNGLVSIPQHDLVVLTKLGKYGLVSTALLGVVIGVGIAFVVGRVINSVEKDIA